jgi:hypothetical protein
MENRVDIIDKLYDRGLLDENDQLLLSDGFDQAIIGITAKKPKRVIYDYYKAVDLIMKEDGDIDLDEVIEWIDDHISYDIGEQTPIFIKVI